MPRVPSSRNRARSSPLDAHAAELLGSTDAFLARRVSWRSLAEGREAPRSLVELAESLAADPATPPLHDQQTIAWAMAISDLARAIAREFPENLFADLDHVAAELRRVVVASGHVALERTIDPLVRIHRAYGLRSRIRFRYVHDFLYGFDWARWVARDPGARAHVGPFDLDFLAHVERRAQELEALIDSNDAGYPELAPGVFRNPFPFDREPDSERALFLSLAADDLLPVRAYDPRPAGPPRERDYARLREGRAQALGLSRSS